MAQATNPASGATHYVLLMVLTWLIVGTLTVAVAGVNIWQLVSYQSQAKLVGPASTLAKAAWIVSLACWFTGPLVVIGAPIGILLGALQFRGGHLATDRIAGRMAVLNGIWIILAGIALAAVVLGSH
jgi:hypothetical protein